MKWEARAKLVPFSKFWILLLYIFIISPDLCVLWKLILDYFRCVDMKMIYDYYLNCYVTPMPTYTVCLQCKKKKTLNNPNCRLLHKSLTQFYKHEENTRFVPAHHCLLIMIHHHQFLTHLQILGKCMKH